MATGHKAFAAKSQASVVAAILEHEPEPLSRVRPLSPPGLEHAVERCLAKDPEERWQSAGDLASELRWIGKNKVAGTAALTRGPTRWWKQWLPWAVVAVAVIAAIAVALLSAGEKSTQSRQQFAVPLAGEVSHLALSPDGKYLAFVSPDEASGTNMVFVQAVGAAEPRMLAGTEGASYPFWSPDDKYVGFFTESKLKKIPAPGGPPQALATVTSARGGTWSRQNVILYAPDAGGSLWRVNADGSNKEQEGERLKSGEA